MPAFEDEIQEQGFREEMQYFQIPLTGNEDDDEGEEDEEEKQMTQQCATAFDPSWCARTLSLENDNKKVVKHGTSHGIIFTRDKLSDILPNHYVEFKVCISVPSKTKSHLFVGVVDKDKYRQDFLTSTYW